MCSQTPTPQSSGTKNWKGRGGRGRRRCPNFPLDPPQPAPFALGHLDIIFYKPFVAGSLAPCRVLLAVVRQWIHAHASISEASWLFPDVPREGCPRILRARVLLTRADRTWNIDTILRAPASGCSVFFVSPE